MASIEGPPQSLCRRSIIGHDRKTKCQVLANIHGRQRMIFNWTLEDGRAIIVNIAAGILQMVILWILALLWKLAARRLDQGDLARYLVDRRVMISTLMILSFALAAMIPPIDPWKVTSYTATALAAALICIAMMFLELYSYWRTGITHVQAKVAANTYSSTLHQVSRTLFMLGTNAFNFCTLPEFEVAANSCREHRGKITLVLAHPDSAALAEAARARGSRPDLYKEQAWFSIGRVLQVKQASSASIEVRLYQARRLDDLPIFRAMFVDDRRVIASVAVYGRADHGSAMPQFFASCKGRRSQAMYSVLWRYASDFQVRSRPLTKAQAESAQQFYARIAAENRSLQS
ncbi:MAG: hypothetical protein QM619_09880 [Micropruina sp.]|uniref:hypothetical protein n=1 Tax=Micropruina sp. TaxID=2737536 RepID=UPI0039E3D045